MAITTDKIKDTYSPYLFEPLDKFTLNSIAQTTANISANYTWDQDSTITLSGGGNIECTTNNQLWATAATTAASYEISDNITSAATNQYIWVSDDNRDYITIDYDNSGQISITPPLSPEELKRKQIRDRLRRNLLPQFLFKRFGLGNVKKPSEARARDALQNIIGNERFRRYLKNGFVSIRGKSGRVYQVFPGHQMTKVWEADEHIEDLCVVLVDSSLPPSDSVIMRMLMILDSEDAFRRVANVFPKGQQGLFANNQQLIIAA